MTLVLITIAVLMLVAFARFVISPDSEKKHYLTASPPTKAQRVNYTYARGSNLPPNLYGQALANKQFKHSTKHYGKNK